MDVRVEQQVQRHGLVDVPGHQAPDFFVHQVVLVQVFDHQLVVGDIHHLADKASLIDHEFVDVQPGQFAFALEQVFGHPCPLHGFHLGDVVPEGIRKFLVALGQQVDVVQQLVVVVVLGFHAKASGFQPHVDVFADQDDVAGFVPGLQGRQGIDDLVVVQVFGQGMGAGAFRAHNDRQGAQRVRFLAAQNGYAFFDVLRAGIAQQFVDIANGLAAVGGNGLFAGLQAVEFFEDGHRDDDIVFFKVQEGIRIVDQDVSVEDVHLLASLRCSGHRVRYLSGGSVVLGAAPAQFPVGNQLQHVVSGNDASDF